MKSVTSSPIERRFQKRERERKEILSIVLHIVSSFSARKRKRKRRILNHSDAVVIDAASEDVHDAASTGAKSAASAVVIDAIPKDVHNAAFPGVFDAAPTVVGDAASTDVHVSAWVNDAASTDVYDATFPGA